MTRNLLKEHKVLMSQLALAGYERVSVSPSPIVRKTRFPHKLRIFMGLFVLLCGWFSGIAISAELRPPDQIAAAAPAQLPTGTVIQIPPNAGGVMILIFPHEETQRHDQHNAHAGYRLHRAHQARLATVRLLVRRDRHLGSRYV